MEVPTLLSSKESSSNRPNAERHCVAAPSLLVLLPGLDGTGDLFAPFLAALGGEVVTFVVRYPTEQPLGYAELEQFVRARLPENEPFVLLGESFSGPVAVRIADAAPANLRGLILCSSFVKNPRPEVAWLRSLAGVLPIKSAPLCLLSRLLMGRNPTEGLRSLFSASLGKVSAATLRARIAAVLSVNVTEELRRIRVPVLYLQATHDRVVPRAAATHISKNLPSARILPVEGPHFLLQAAPARAAAAVMSFLAGAENAI